MVRSDGDSVSAAPPGETSLAAGCRRQCHGAGWCLGPQRLPACFTLSTAWVRASDPGPMLWPGEQPTSRPSDPQEDTGLDVLKNPLWGDGLGNDYHVSLDLKPDQNLRGKKPNMRWGHVGKGFRLLPRGSRFLCTKPVGAVDAVTTCSPFWSLRDTNHVVHWATSTVRGTPPAVGLRRRAGASARLHDCIWSSDTGHRSKDRVLGASLVTQRVG